MPASELTKVPTPYHAVIFVSQRTPGDNGYADASAQMVTMARQQPGFIGMESARAADGKGITVAFFETEQAIRDWGRNAEHREVQAEGRATWYDSYQIYYSRVERVRSWTKPAHAASSNGASSDIATSNLAVANSEIANSEIANSQIANSQIANSA